MTLRRAERSMGAWLPFVARARKCALFVFPPPQGGGGDRPKGGGGGDNPTARSSAACPLHHASRGPLPRAARGGGIKEIVLATRLARPSLVDHHKRQGSICYPKKGGGAPKGACQPLPHQARLRCSRVRGAPAIPALTLRHSPPATTPDGSAPEPGFPQTETCPVFCPLGLQSCLRFSTLRADRSFCRSTGDPRAARERSGIIRRAGTAPRSAFQACPSGRAPSVERGAHYVT